MNALKSMVLGGLSFLLSSCIVLPIPWKEAPPRFSEPQLATLKEGTTTRDEIRGTLGTPNLRRAQDRLWIYSWSRDKGKWVAIPLVPVWGGVLSPVTSKPFALFLEFDPSGVLQRETFAQRVENSNDNRLCTARGLCVEHQVVVATNDMTGEMVSGFSDTWSAVTAVGETKAEYDWPIPGQGECLAVLWLDEEWERNRGVGVGFDDLPEDDAPTWLPRGAFAIFVQAEGEHIVRLYPFSADDSSHSELVGRATLQCRSGEEHFLQISKAPENDAEGGVPVSRLPGESPILLKPSDQQTARARLESMPRVLVKSERSNGLSNSPSTP